MPRADDRNPRHAERLDIAPDVQHRRRVVDLKQLAWVSRVVRNQHGRARRVHFLQFLVGKLHR